MANQIGDIAEYPDGRQVQWDGQQWAPIPRGAQIPPLIRSPGPGQEPGMLRGLLSSGMQGATSEMGEELRAGVNTLGDVGRGLLGMEGGIDALQGGHRPSLSLEKIAPRYQAHRDLLRNEQTQFDQNNPVSAIGARMIGAAAPAGLARMAAPVATQAFADYAVSHPLKAGIVGGAAGGALAGAGMAPEMADVPSQAATGAGVGAVTGYGASAALRSLAKGYQGAKRLGQKLVAESTPRREAASIVRKNLQFDYPDTKSAIKAVSELGPEGRLVHTGTNVEGLAGTIAAQPGRGQARIRSGLERIRTGQTRRLESVLKSSTGRDGEYLRHVSEAMAARAKASGPYYRAAEKEFAPEADIRAIADNVNDLATSTFQGTPIGRKLRSAWRMLYSEVPKGKSLGAVKTNIGIELQSVKEQLDDMVSTAYRNGRGKEGARLADMRRDLLEVMNRSGPYNQARELYAGMSETIDAMQLGRRVFREDAEELTEAVARMTAGERDAFTIGAVKAARDTVGSLSDFSTSGANPVVKMLGNQNKRDALQTALGDAYPVFEQALRREGTFAQVQQAVIQNSQTARRMMSAQQPIDIPTSAYDASLKAMRFAIKQMKGSGKMSEPVRNEVARLLVEVPAEELPEALGRMSLPPEVYQNIVREFAGGVSILGGYAGAAGNQYGSN